MPILVPVNDQQRQAENGCELDNTQKNSRQKSSLEMIYSDNRIIINFCVPTTQDGVTRHTLLSALELNNNRLLDKDNSLNLTGKNTPTSGSRFDEHTVTRRSTEAGEEDLSQGLPATESSVQAWPLRYIQQQAERTYQSIRQWVVRLFLYLAGPVPTRQRWNSTADSIMGLLAVVVGLGNMWGFPYYYYKHQGAYFLFAYGIVLLFIGFPLYVVNLSIGQYLSLGPTNAYASMAPLFSGLGWAMVISSALASTYYAVVLGWTITYIQRSLMGDYPFAPESTRRNDTYQRATDFFRNVVHLNEDGFVNVIQHQSVLSLGLVWLFVTIFLVRGIRSSSKVVYFTNTFPYGVMILLLVYSYYWESTKGSTNLHFFTPQKNATELLSPEIWADAVSQVLFTLGHFFGGAITLSSYNDLRQNTLRTALSIILWDTATSLLYGYLVFVSLNKLTSGPDLDVDIGTVFNANQTVSRMGMEVVFIAYPAFLADLNSSWFVLFFLMILTLGIDSLMGFAEIVTTALFDNFTCLRSRYFPSVCTVVLVMFLLGLPMCTGNGFYIVECMHSYTCHLSLPLLGITHIALVCYVFGFDDLMAILRQELRVTVPKFIEWYLKLSLKYICPVAFLCLIISTTLNTEGLWDSRLTPIKWILSIFPFLLVPAFAIYKVIRFRDRDWRLLLRPTKDFLPAYLREHSNRPDMFILADY
ncbi:sodium-dependent noradrenaline transporter-like isoform X2 [Macrobrachium nipponense]|uniref:sodium-dependent noradrenaline transporter-like isoform X2 n=1 Tax=Macrobrachium nipponense TaxID=159736 RepID=UPI0030C82794